MAEEKDYILYVKYATHLGASVNFALHKLEMTDTPNGMDYIAMSILKAGFYIGEHDQEGGRHYIAPHRVWEVSVVAV